MKALPTHTSLNSFIIQPESYGATVDEGFIVGGPVGDFELLLCHGTVCVVGKMRDLILQLSKSSIIQQSPNQGEIGPGAGASHMKRIISAGESMERYRFMSVNGKQGRLLRRCLS